MKYALPLCGSAEVGTIVTSRPGEVSIHALAVAESGKTAHSPTGSACPAQLALMPSAACRPAWAVHRSAPGVSLCRMDYI